MRDLVKEIDTQPGTRFAFTAPATGSSFSFPNVEVARFVDPLVELTNLRDERGNREDGLSDAICAALT